MAITIDVRYESSQPARARVHFDGINGTVTYSIEQSTATLTELEIPARQGESQVDVINLEKIRAVQNSLQSANQAIRQLDFITTVNNELV